MYHYPMRGSESLVTALFWPAPRSQQGSGNEILMLETFQVRMMNIGVYALMPQSDLGEELHRLQESQQAANLPLQNACLRLGAQYLRYFPFCMWLA